MSQQGIIQRFPTKRLVAADGMAVTAEVWNQAHEYHRQFFAAHAQATYGAGIVTGLEVIADTPPGSVIHVMPGVAIDHYGQTIVVPSAQSYNLRDQEGIIYLVLTYSEGTPRSAADAGGADAPRFAPIVYSLEAKTALPAEPYVELARIRRPSATTPITNAQNSEAPTVYEIELRFRRQIVIPSTQPMILAIKALDGQVANEHVAGWQNLLRELRFTTHQPLWIDQNVDLEGTLFDYPLLALTGQGAFTLSRPELNGLHEYVKSGGILFFESCRRTLQPSIAEADSVWENLVSSMGSQLVAIPPTHPLLCKPYFFPQLPAGYKPGAGGALRIAEGIGKGLILHSTFDYSCLWAGDRGGQRLTREEVRAAFEWGANLLTFATDHHQQVLLQSGSNHRSVR